LRGGSGSAEANRIGGGRAGGGHVGHLTNFDFIVNRGRSGLGLKSEGNESTNELWCGAVAVEGVERICGNS